MEAYGFFLHYSSESSEEEYLCDYEKENQEMLGILATSIAN